MNKNLDALDLDAIIAGISDPAVGDNATSILGVLQEVNKNMTEFSKTVGFLQEWGVLTPILRIASSKMGIDIDKPLEGSFTPKSPWHSVIFTELNTLEPDQVIAKMGEITKEVESKKTQKVKEDAEGS